MKPVQFFAGSDIVVMYLNSEMADYDNPRGEIYGYASYVYAEDDLGFRRRKFVNTTVCAYGEARAMESANRMALALNNRLSNGKLPVGFDSWGEVSPAYGSEAYIKSGAEDDLIAWEQGLEDF